MEFLFFATVQKIIFQIDSMLSHSARDLIGSILGQRIEERDFLLPRSDGKIQALIGSRFEKLLGQFSFSIALVWNAMLSAIGCRCALHKKSLILLKMRD